jgi:hypothetical protein
LNDLGFADSGCCKKCAFRVTVFAYQDPFE